MRGIYILILKLNKNIKLEVGRLGGINFTKGLYAYVGSAMNGIENRVKRHFSDNKKIYWHIDYLLKNKSIKIKAVLYKKANKKEECKIAKKLNKAGVLIPNFGSSDCKCKSHLFKIKNLKIISKLKFKEYKK